MSFCVKLKVIDLVKVHRVPNPDKESLPTALSVVFSFQIPDVVHLLTDEADEASEKCES